MKNFAINLAKESGKIIRDNFGKIEKYEEKSRTELVTEVDKKVDEYIVKRIKEKYPEHNILIEESGKHDKQSDYTWVVDPLDGTHNFIYGLPMFGVSIALMHKQEVILGVIYFPMYEELYVAEKKKGAFLNGKKIKVSKKKIKEHNVMVFDAHFGAGDKENKLRIFSNLVDYISKVRVFGCATLNLVYVASGKADLGFLINTHSWDFAAGVLIVEEAGGKVTDLKGNKWTIDSERLVASNNKFHDKIIEIIK